MECAGDSITVNYSSTPTSSPPGSQAPSSSSLSRHPAAPPAIVSPCAACKTLRRRCAEKCVLAPYFPPTEPAKFTTAHRVFGASNIIKFLQDLPESQRADAVASLVYEASARIRDPVYGCAGAICQLQKQVTELQAQLARAQAELVNMQNQQASLVAMLCLEMASQTSQPPTFQHSANSSLDSLRIHQHDPSSLEDAANSSSIWDQMMLETAT